jgi:hypothetical protein
MPSTRIAKTLERLRAGALPSAFMAVRAFKSTGTGTACTGCGEAIGRLESAYHVRVTGAEGLRLHTACHETWIRFKRPA